MTHCLRWERRGLAMKTKRLMVSIGILALSVLFIGIGVVNKEHMEVMQKAVMVCLECIGIG